MTEYRRCLIGYDWWQEVQAAPLIIGGMVATAAAVTLAWLTFWITVALIIVTWRLCVARRDYWWRRWERHVASQDYRESRP